MTWEGMNSKFVARQAATWALTVFLAVKLIASSSPGLTQESSNRCR